MVADIRFQFVESCKAPRYEMFINGQFIYPGCFILFTSIEPDEVHVGFVESIDVEERMIHGKHWLTVDPDFQIDPASNESIELVQTTLEFSVSFDAFLRKTEVHHLLERATTTGFFFHCHMDPNGEKIEIETYTTLKRFELLAKLYLPEDGSVWYELWSAYCLTLREHLQKRLAGASHRIVWKPFTWKNFVALSLKKGAGKIRKNGLKYQIVFDKVEDTKAIFGGEWWHVARRRGGYSTVHGPLTIVFNRARPDHVAINFRGITTTNTAGHRMWDSTTRRGRVSVAPPLNDQEALVENFLCTMPTDD